MTDDWSGPARAVPRLRGLVGVLALVVAAAACNGTRSDDIEGQPLRGRAVEVAAVWTGQEQANLEKALVRFEQETGAAVHYTPLGNDIAAALASRLEEGTPPDIVILPGPALLPDLAARGAIKPLGESVQKLVDQNFAPAWRDLGSVDGKLFGVWVKAVNKSTLLYRPRAFHDAGVQPPTTWKELLECARSLAGAGKTPVSLAGGDGWPLTDWFENMYLRIAGPEKYDQLAHRRLAWTDESVKRALSRLGELWGDRALIIDGASTRTLEQSIAHVLGAPPGAAMAYDGGFVSRGSAMVPTPASDADGELFEFPSVDGSPKVVVGSGDVAVRLADDPAASALMAFLAGPKAGDVWAESGSFVSPNNKVNLDFYPDEMTRQSARWMVEADDFRFDLSDLQPAEFAGRPNQGMWKILQDFLAAPDDVDVTARALEAAAARAFDR